MGGGGEGGDAAFAQGLLAGAGLRELSQVLGLSRRRNGNSGSEPSAATLMGGNLGDLDKVMLLAKLQTAMKPPAPMGVPPMPGVPGAGPAGPMAAPMPPPAGPMPAMAPPGMPMRPPMTPGPGVPPGMPGAMPGMAATAPQQPAGGALAQALLRQMLTSAAGPV